MELSIVGIVGVLVIVALARWAEARREAWLRKRHDAFFGKPTDPPQ